MESAPERPRITPDSVALVRGLVRNKARPDKRVFCCLRRRRFRFEIQPLREPSRRLNFGETVSRLCPTAKSGVSRVPKGAGNPRFSIQSPMRGSH